MSFHFHAAKFVNSLRFMNFTETKALFITDAFEFNKKEVYGVPKK
jgi:hypothetical protein